MRESVKKKCTFSSRFRNMLPIVVDVETSGLNSVTDSLLEIAVVTLKMDENGIITPSESFSYHVEAFEGANMDPEALAVNQIDPGNPLRYAIPEQQALHLIFRRIKKLLDYHQCQRAILVGHNAWFDLGFIQAAIKRTRIQESPIHSFTSIDTASLSVAILGETVLARAAKAASIDFDINKAHSGVYDAQVTAELFCWLINKLTKSNEGAGKPY